MSDREQTAKSTSKTVSHRTGIRAALSSLGRSKGTGAPAAKFLGLLAIPLIALFATAASASAAPLSAEMGTVSNVTYGSADVTGKVTSPGKGSFFPASYTFEYSTDEINWTPGPGGDLGGGAFENQEVEGHVTALNGSTHYFVRLSAKVFLSNVTSPEGAPYPDFTTLAADPPTVEATDNSSEVEYTQAKASGKVNRPLKSDDLTCNFEYISDEQFTANQGASQPGFQGATPTACDQSPVATVGSSTVSAKLPGLSPATTYHLRLAVSAAGGSDSKDAAATFTTLGPVPKPAVIATDAATELGKRSAQASGKVERPAGADPALDVSCHFEFVSDEQFNANPPGEEFAGAGRADCAQNPVTSPAPGYPAVAADVSAELGGLTPDTEYHLRLAAENGGGTVTKDAPTTFTTEKAVIPTVTIDPVAPTGTYTTAEVSGTVNPNGGLVIGSSYAVFWRFEYSTEPADPFSWTASNVGGEFGVPDNLATTPVPVAGTIEGLQFGTTYYLRLSAEIATEPQAISPESPGPYPSFTTGTVNAPGVTLDPVTTFTGTSAKFTGTVNANAPGPLNPAGEAAYKTSWHITCTPACPKLSEGGEGTVEAGDGDKTISVDADELEPNTHYEVALEAGNAAGPAAAGPEAFTTAAVAPTVKSAPGASDGQGGYTLQGVVNPHNNKVTACEFKWGPNAPSYAFSAPCSPLPTGVSERQRVRVEATSGQFRLSFGGQTTNDIPFNAEASTVQAELESLSSIGSSGVSGVTRSLEESVSPVRVYDIAFSGPLAERNLPQLQAENGTEPLVGNSGGGTAGVSTVTDGGTNTAITVEAHLTGLTPGATYHALLVITYDAGTKADGGDQAFVPTQDAAQPCPNEQLRKENSSLALPECRAYEMVSSPNKSGFPAELTDYTGDGSSVAYNSQAGNISNSGSGLIKNGYVANRTDASWETIPNLNGPLGSPFVGPEGLNHILAFSSQIYSVNLRSSLWFAHSNGQPGNGWFPYLRKPDGTFTLVGNTLDAGGVIANSFPEWLFIGSSADLSHVVFNGTAYGLGSGFGRGLYEFVGIGNDQPRRVDIDNTGTPTSSCTGINADAGGNASGNAVSGDGRVIVFTAFGGCGGPNPPANELWARVNGNTSYDLGASQCNRAPTDSGGACSDPPCPLVEGKYCDPSFGPQFAGFASGASRVYFTTTQQLVDGDTDPTNDLYACDLPTTPQAPVGNANPCSALHQVSAGGANGAKVESVASVSADGSTVYFTAEGILATNEDALGEKAVAGDHNLYVWRTDAAHPTGQMAFLGRLDANDVGGTVGNAQTTADGQFLVFTTASQLVATDTDSSRDVYRYDVDTGQMTRVSTNVFGVAGNADGVNASVIAKISSGGHPTTHDSHPAVSDDGAAIVFTTSEALSPLDGNGQPDVYLWRAGHGFLISTGAVGVESRAAVGSSGSVATIDGSGQNIYFNTVHPLTPSDGDDVADVYDARIGGGFEPPQPGCSGEACQALAPAPPITPLSPVNRPNGENNVKPCPKGKIAKGNKCVKKSHGKHRKKEGKGKAHKAGHNRGGSK